MVEKIMAAAALIGSLVNLGMLMIHCRRDRREFKKLQKSEEIRA